MNHSFNVEIAQKYGIEEAILIENLAYWIKKNAVNDKHFHDGHYWTYNSVAAFSELFPYMSPDKIRRKLENLEKHGLIKTGNYNEVAYDRKKWYAIIDKCILQMYKIHLANMPNEFGENAKPIADINTDIKTDINISEKKFSGNISNNSFSINANRNNNKQSTSNQALTKKNKEDLTPKNQSLHASLKEIFLAKYHSATEKEYYWTAMDGKHMKQLIEKLQNEKEGTPEVNFTMMLDNLPDFWRDKLEVSILNTKYNMINSQIKNQKTTKGYYERAKEAGIDVSRF